MLFAAETKILVGEAMRTGVSRIGLATLVALSFPFPVQANDPCAATAGDSTLVGPPGSAWTRYEIPLTSQEDYLGIDRKGNPQRDLKLTVTFTKCDGANPAVVFNTQGFWYGLKEDGSTLDGRSFLIRGAFPSGTWQWEVSCALRPNATLSTPDCSRIPDPGNPAQLRPDPGLKRKGRFRINKSPAGNPLYSGGLLKAAGHYLTLDGKKSKFFWLGDTTWNANLLMTQADWALYIGNRTAKESGLDGTQFTVVQLGIAPRAAGSADRLNQPPFDRISNDSSCPEVSTNSPAACFRMNPRFWKAVDDKIEFANKNGIVVVLVGFIEPVTKDLLDAFSTISTDCEELKIFAQSVAARLSGNFVVFSPGFDHKLQAGNNPDICKADDGNFLIRIRDVGRIINDEATSRHLIANHCAGGSSPEEYLTNLQDEPWLDFELFQSGTPGGSTAEVLHNLTLRAASMASILWTAKGHQVKPAINGESVYPSVSSHVDPLANQGRYRARQTAYLSMLSGASGYTMGTCGVVDWGKGQISQCPGGLEWQWDSEDPLFMASTMKILRAHFQSITNWELLRPEPKRIRNQTSLPETNMALAYEGRSALLAYLPHEVESIEINFNAIPSGDPTIPGLAAIRGPANADGWPTNWSAVWLSPRSLHVGDPGQPQSATPVPVFSTTGQRVRGAFRFAKPNPRCDLASCDAEDWVLRIVKGSKSQLTSSAGVAVVAVHGPGPVSAGLRIIAETMEASSGKVLLQKEIGGQGSTSPGPPQIATEPGGNNLVVWQADSDATTSISARVLDSQGQPVTPEFVVASGTAASPGHPSVAALANGDFLVVWSGSDENRYGPWIRVQRFSRSGTPLTPAQIAVNCQYLPGDFPQAAAVGPGGYAIAWEMEGGGIYVLQVDSGGSRGEARIAQVPGTTAVLESLDPGDVNAVVSYGLYTDNGFLNGDSVTAVTQASSCPLPPLALDDAFSTDMNQPVTIGSQELLGNDAPGVSLSQLSSKCALAQDGSSCTYTPPAGFFGIDTFTYLVRDVANNLGTATVSIEIRDTRPQAKFTISCVNRSCTLRTQSEALKGIAKYLWNWGDGSPTIEVATNDPQIRTYALSGRYTITHTVVDTSGQTGALQLDTVANTKPVAANDAAATERDIAVNVNVVGNDADGDGDALSLASVTFQNPGASYQVVANGTSWLLRITPPDTFVGALPFTYVVADRWGATATASVTLNVTQWTSITDAVGEQFACSQNGSLRIPVSTLLSNDYDSDGDPLAIVAKDTSILMGTLDCASDPTACTYRPPLNAAGYTLFRYTASDPIGHRDSATVRIYVGVLGSAPTLKDDYFTTPRNNPRVFTVQEVTQNDVDPDGDTLTVGLIGGAREYGSLGCSTPMYRCTYTPNAGFVGTDRFGYTATDNLNGQKSAAINVLTLPPATPAFDAREDVVVTGLNTQTFFSNALLTSNDYDPERDPIAVLGVDPTGLQGTLTCDSMGCVYKPPFSFQGITRFKYTATDGHGSSDIAIVRIRVGGTNSPPVAVPDSLSTAKNTPLRFSVFELLKNDYDLDDDPLNVIVYESTAQRGTLSCGTPSYWCTYTPSVNMVGTDTITYALSDGSAVTSTLSINVLP